jgi:peroxiredoxin
VTEQIAVGQEAPDFELTDVQGRMIRLSDYRGKKHVILNFTRGFL